MLPNIYRLLLLPLIFCYNFLHAQTVTYTESTEDIVNPDRGFYHPVHTHTSSFTPLSLSSLQSKRTTAFTPWQADYMVRTSLVFRHYVLDNFVDTDILSSTFLNDLQADFDIARQAGVKLIVRFSYTTSPNTSCGASACPLYGDAPKSRVLAHIAQLKPYLQANEDVITVVQSGFIGVWGEQYYTDYFGDASGNGQGKIYDANWLDRNEFLAAMLDAVPVSRMVQVRYPQLKQRYLGGVNTPVSYPAITSGQAHNGSDISRIGFHNDCFLASSDDYGTYWDYGNGDAGSGDSPSNQTGILKPYWADDSKYTAIGGETCDDSNFSPENDCSGQALTDMAMLHYSFLNSDYNNAVNNDWHNGGCMDEIKQKLGYRLVMQDGTYPSAASAGSNLDFTINIENVGWAAPFNERTLQLVLRNTASNTEYELPISGTNTDTRFWHTGSINLQGSVMLPSNMESGDYQLFLQIFDPSNNGMVADRPEYCIQMANTNTWDMNTGYNDLNHTIEITGTVAGCQIGINGNFQDWDNFSPISTNGSGGLTELKVADDENFIYLYAGNVTDEHYQFYLDVDNDAIGGNEFNNSYWPSSGINFFVENGSLHQYSGDGSNWSWSFIASVNAAKTANGVELEIDKSLLTGLGTHINAGYVNLNSGWSVIAKIPDANSAAPYELSSILDCGCRSDNLLLSGDVTTTQIYETNGTIESTQIISGDISVVYNSPVSVLLDNGFSVEGGTTFEVILEGCVENNLEADTPFFINPSTDDDLVLPQTITIFPNPVEDRLMLKSEILTSANCSIQVINALGEIVLQPHSNERWEANAFLLEIEVQTLPKGVYFVVLENGKEMQIGKFIKN